MTRPGLETTIYNTRVKHASHNITDAVLAIRKILWCIWHIYRHDTYMENHFKNLKDNKKLKYAIM